MCCENRASFDANCHGATLPSTTVASQVLLSSPALPRPSCCASPDLLQAGAGLVADSVPESEYEETVNKSAALGRAIDLAEQAFVAAADATQ